MNRNDRNRYISRAAVCVKTACSEHTARVRRLLSAVGLLLCLCAGCGQMPGEPAGAAERAAVRTTAEKPDSSDMEVHFIDVGQGDATLILCDGHAMLIDAGDNDKGTAVQSYLLSQKVETLDYVIGTHPDADHIGGLDVVLYKFDCGTVILPDIESDTKTYEDVLAAMSEKDYAVTYPKVGQTYPLGDAAFTIVAPNRDYGSDKNDGSVGILLQNGENRFLLTGDAGEEAERDMLANGMDLSADVYKVAHHGSDTGSSEAFLAAVAPDWAVISVGEDNQYGHPDAQVLNDLRGAGVSVFRTDEQGTIVAVSDGTEITWNASPSESWRAGERRAAREEGTKASGAVTAPQGEENGTSAEEEAEAVVHITDSGAKYHAAGCRYLGQSDSEVTLAEAKARGLEPCGACRPPQ